MKRIRGASKQQLHGFIQEAVEPDSTIHTDGWEGYVGLEALGYRHEYDFLAGSSQSASELLPHVHRVAALLKRWLIGTHQGAVSREHLDYYLDEYTFRFNRRRSRHRGKLFYRLVQQAATVGPTTYSEMVQHLRGRRTGQPQDVGVVGSEVHTPIAGIRPSSRPSSATIRSRYESSIERWGYSLPTVSGETASMRQTRTGTR